MSTYADAKIYAIMSPSTPKIYIGSTIHSLEHRFKQHNNSPSVAVYEILQYDDAYIQLIENYPCSNARELEQQEGFYILNNDCSNTRLRNFKNTESILPYVPSPPTPRISRYDTTGPYRLPYPPP